MGKIIIYNTKNEDHTQEPNNFYVGRSKNGNPLGNPFGIGGKRPSLVKMTFPTREEAIGAYKLYFDCKNIRSLQRIQDINCFEDLMSRVCFISIMKIEIYW